MNDSAVRVEMLKIISIDPDFESVCPPLTEDEFTLLEQNILSDGEVTSPLIVWDNKLIDGHHRRQIILNHPELPFQVKEVAFNNKYEAIAWICKNQAGRRNLTSEQLTYLIGKQYEAEKQSWGASDGFRGNGNEESVSYQNDNLPKTEKTNERIAKEYGIGSASVSRAEKYAKGVDAAEAVCPGVKQELLSGTFKPTKKEVSELSMLPAEEVSDKLSEYRKAQEEREEKRRQAREEKCRQAEGATETDDGYNSISDLSANMAEPKRRNNVSNVIGIISEMAQKLQATCETYIDEFPELTETEKPQLFQALDDLREYLNELYKED